MKARGGSADFENIPASMQASFADTTFDADLVLPAELTLGASYNLNPGTVLAFDINREILLTRRNDGTWYLDD